MKPYLDLLLTPPGKLACAAALFVVAQNAKRLAPVKAWLEADPLRVRLLVLALGAIPFGAFTVAGSPIDATLTTLATAVLGAMGLHSAKPRRKDEPPPTVPSEKGWSVAVDPPAKPVSKGRKRAPKPKATP